MTEENQNKHVTFAAGTSEGGTVEAVVERGQEAAGYVAETVMSYIPGTDEYEVRVHGQNLETSPVSPVGPVRHDTSPHDADGNVAVLLV